MKKLVILTILCTSAFANQIIKLYDGGGASCTSNYDVVDSQINNVYSLKIIKQNEKKKSIALKMRIQFYSCVKVNNEYKFVLNTNHGQAHYQFMQNDVKKKDISKKLILTNDAIQKLGEINIDLNNPSQIISIELDKNDLSINNFPEAQHRGNYYFDISMTAISDVLVNDKGPFRDHTIYGGFRVFIK